MFLEVECFLRYYFWFMVTIVIKSGCGQKCARRPYSTLLTESFKGLRLNSDEFCLAVLPLDIR